MVVGMRLRVTSLTLRAPRRELTRALSTSTDVLSAFRRWGHLRADLSPLASAGLGPARSVEGLPPRGAHADLDALYCATIGFEFEHCATAAERAWWAAAAEAPAAAATPSEERNAATLMLRGAELEAFLARRYPGLKQYGGSGCEALLPAVDALVAAAGAAGATRVVVGQAHRGRLALLVALLGYPARKLLYKLDGHDEIPGALPGVDDVSSHCYVSSTLGRVAVSLLPNPSHLEAVNPVVQGRVRAARDSGEDAVALLIHGDGAFSGQGVVAEGFAASKTPAFDVGGTLHIVTNNLLGFTAGARVGRSSQYATDVAKSVDAPVVHVNAEDVPAVLRACKLAAACRAQFHKDVVVDLIGYRRAGHNEVDEPAFTSPRLYKEIAAREPFAAAYGRRVLGERDAAGVVARAAAHFDAEMTIVRAGAGDGASSAGKGAGVSLAAPFTAAGGATGAGSGAAASLDGSHVVLDGSAFGGAWSSVRLALSPEELFTSPDTGAPLEALRSAGAASVALPPPPFAPHERLARGHIAPRLAALAGDSAARTIDWATAEALAFGLTLGEGRAVRLCGQDVERGTFSHRHAVFVDSATEARARAFPAHEGRFHVHSSLLSEEAVLGYEWGYSLASPHNLVLWEAQFGDFANSAQVVIDNFVATGESKWLRSSGLVMLLPHGQDGAGPEHSSARIERFLQLTNAPAWAGPHGAVGSDRAVREPLNLLVAQPSTPANYFHLLRRQLARPFRKPLVVATPKQLLRLPEAQSALLDMAPATRFQPVLSDVATAGTPADVRRVVLCSGKLFYELDAARRTRGLERTIALVRVEELAPWPAARVAEELARYSAATSVVWAQDEPANAGAWAWARMHLPSSVSYVGRPALATAAVGLKKRFAAMQAEIVTECMRVR